MKLTKKTFADLHITLRIESTTRYIWISDHFCITLMSDEVPLKYAGLKDRF